MNDTSSNRKYPRLKLACSFQDWGSKYWLRGYLYAGHYVYVHYDVISGTVELKLGRHVLHVHVGQTDLCCQFSVGSNSPLGQGWQAKHQMHSRSLKLLPSSSPIFIMGTSPTFTFPVEMTAYYFSLGILGHGYILKFIICGTRHCAEDEVVVDVGMAVVYSFCNMIFKTAFALLVRRHRQSCMFVCNCGSGPSLLFYWLPVAAGLFLKKCFRSF
jgi:hypothetical protein